MLDKTTLGKILADPDSTAEERELAQRQLAAAMGEAPTTLAASSFERELELLFYGPELKTLLDFAGVTRVSDLTVDAATLYVDAQPQPLSKSTLRVLRCFSARGLWPQFKATFPESERRAKFTKFAVEHPYLVQDLAYYDAEARRRFSFWATMCEHQTAYAVRVHLIQHVHEVLNGLKEFQFELRDEIQTWISTQEKRWTPQEPWMWTDAMNISHPGPKQGRA